MKYAILFYFRLSEVEHGEMPEIGQYSAFENKRKKKTEKHQSTSNVTKQFTRNGLTYSFKKHFFLVHFLLAPNLLRMSFPRLHFLCPVSQFLYLFRLISLLFLSL